MNITYHYLIMSQKDFLYNQVIEELLREKSNYFISQNKKRDFWVLTSPQIIKNKEINNKIKESNFYLKNKELINSSEEFFCNALVSTNLEFIDWFKLRIGDFEEIDANVNKKDYRIDGIYLKIENKISNNDILNFNKKSIDSTILEKQFSNFVKNSYYSNF